MQPTLRIPLAFAVCVAVGFGATQSVRAAPPGKQAAAQGWRPTGCPPPPESGSGPSSVKITGPCGFEHTGEAECDAEGDDFLVTMVRPARNAAELMLFLNVERYVGPRTYKPPNDMWVSLKVGSKIYRWSTNAYEATVGPGSRSVTFKDVRLEAEPVLIGCTGPQTNYQCDGRQDEPRHEASVSIASGTIYCKARGPR